MMKVVRLAGLWEQIDKQGNHLLSGDLNDISRVVVMKNPSKKRAKDPDYYLCIGAKSKVVKDKKSLH